MSASVETIANTTKKQKLNNGSPLSTMSVPNPTPTPAPVSASPAPATPAPATPIPTNGVQPQAPTQWAQIPIDPALQNAQPYPQYAWPPQPTGAPAVASPAPTTATATVAPTPQPIRAKPSTPAPAASSPAPTTAPATSTTPAPAPGTTPATPYAASPYYPPGYRYPYPYQGQPQYTYTYANGQYYAVPQQVAQPAATTTAQTTTTTPATGTAATAPARVMMPTAASSATTNSTAQAVAGVGQPLQQQPTSQLNDALAGIVDLRAEEDALARGHQDVGNTYYHREGDRSKRVGPALESSKLWMSERLKAILSAQGLTNLPEEALNYAMLAWKARLQMLWDKALAAAEHRYSSQYSRPPSFWNPPPADGSTPNPSVPPTPMWSTVIKRDVAKQISAIERAEKEEETRARRERRTAVAQAEADDAVEDDDPDGRKAKKMRALGPGVTARLMPEDVKKKMSDNTANRAAGLGTGKYAWMTAGAAGGAAGTPAPPKPKPAPTPAPATTATTTGTATATTTPAATATATATATTAATAPKAGGWGRAYAAVSKTAAGTESKEEGVTVTLRDALFVASRERGFGGGRGSALASAGKWE
ncbi:hypothetical protein RSOLAG22IIIB_01919 [Rhizoctonia solani]|uniref:Transcription initiation factor TFIID subunit 4 n=1 Tax=Rhizoctonia solani TaxID=456999 RepID=A0A0K6GBP9_9AGAM|nr:hypothetical protein RSOLAG22IIIB_01919 [Rhizoctonia solani]